MSFDLFSLRDKTALITGGGTGIGFAIAQAFCEAGAHVIIVGRREDVLQQACEKLGKTASYRACDLSRVEVIPDFIAGIEKDGIALDILVNNAGIYDFKPLADVTPEHFHSLFDLNVLGLLLTTQEAIKLIGSEGGSVINISSIVGQMPVPTAAVYSATKASVDAITVSLAGELGAKKIRVNSLNPGMVETEGLHSVGFAVSDFRKHVEATTPLGRIGQPNDIATAAVFLASDDSGWITGQTLIAAGGARQ